VTLSGVLLIRGLLRGTLAQVFAFAGLVLGVLVGSAVADWVGTQWHSARPEFVFTLLRWSVAALSGLGVAAVMHAWGDLLSKAAHDGPFGWLDRVIGAAFGLAVGLVCSVAVLVLLLPGAGLEFARPSCAGRTTGPLTAGDLASSLEQGFARRTLAARTAAQRPPPGGTPPGLSVAVSTVSPPPAMRRWKVPVASVSRASAFPRADRISARHRRHRCASRLSRVRPSGGRCTADRAVVSP
jgi:hypothetical protein